VLSFYRGDWCPYCNLALRAWQERLDELTNAGGQFVAVTPQRPPNALALSEKHGLIFPVLSDETQQVIRAYKLLFDLPPALKDLYSGAWGLDLTEQNADGSWSLPVPGTFVVDHNREVRYSFASADYRQRAEPDDVLAAVRSL
jgi:peroxiredoxin